MKLQFPIKHYTPEEINAAPIQQRDEMRLQNGTRTIDNVLIILFVLLFVALMAWVV